jgi:putative transposase
MFASEVVIAAKKDAVTGEWTDKRFCVDYRSLNKAMLIDLYRLPLPDALFDAIGDSCCFSKIDARSAFMQRDIRKEDQSKTAFWWRGGQPCSLTLPCMFSAMPANCARQREHRD